MSVTLGTVILLRGRASAESLSFADSGLDGGGFQNVVAWSPFKNSTGQRPVLLGADIAGVSISYDGGENWTPSNVGLGDPHVAALMWSNIVPGKIYAATDSAIYVSTNWGVTWTARSGQVNFDANGDYKANGQEQPRSTGNLLAQDNSGTTHYLYAATTTEGVKRSDDDGNTWQAVALSGQHMRSMALDPSNPNVLYVGSVEGGLEMTSTATSSFTFSRVAGEPSGIPEEMNFIGANLYVAHGTAGIYEYAKNVWTALNNGVPTSGPSWESIIGTTDANGDTVLYAGCANPTKGENTIKSTNGGASWTSMSTGPAVTIESREYGQNINWWADNNSYLSVTGSAFVTSDLAIDPDNPNDLLLAGRGGAKAIQQSATGVIWWPSVRGLMVTVDMSVVPDPKLPGRVYIGSMDYTILASTDHATTILEGLLPSGAPSVGDAIALDSDGPSGQASTVYLAAGVRGQNTGEGYIYSNPDPVANPKDWTNEDLPVSNNVLALGVGHDSSGNRIILASVTGSGLYRKDASSWSQVTGTSPFVGGDYGDIVWVPGTATVYAMDGSDVWRSDSAGASGTWVKLASASAGYDNINTIALDPNDPSIIYVSGYDYGGVARINDANGSSPTVTKIYSTNNPGPIAMSSSGILYADSSAGASLMQSSDPEAQTPSFTNIANAFYANNAQAIRSLAVGPDGYIYTAANHAGVIVGTPTSGTPSSTPSPSPS
ncbi:MAG TPA: hypothetical protein VMS08_04205, partial [Candidatus Saccharimonadia bacterium]|nr:hypothetical protein [Candidatus Saccharimonadia bacterium]